MRKVVITPFGNKIQLQAIQKELSPDRIYIACFDESCPVLEEFINKHKDELELKKVALSNNLFEGIFQKLQELKLSEKKAEIFVNCACGDSYYDGLFLVAAMANQLKAFTINKRHLQFYPYLKLNYYNLLSDKKLEILKFLYEDKCCASMEELSKKLNMSLPLVSYHINGNLKSEGLKDMGLIDVVQIKNKIDIRISNVGRLLLFGYLDQEKK